MKINPIYHKDCQINTSFTSADKFMPIKTIPNMICAVCGKPTISIDTFVKTISPLSQPLSYNIEKGALDFIKNRFPIIWNKILDLQTKFPKSSLDDIVNNEKGAYAELKQSVIEELQPLDTVDPTESIEQDRRINSLFFNTLDAGRSYMKNSAFVFKNIIGLKQYLSGLKKEVFEQFEIYSRKYPDKSLSEIVRLPEVHSFHSAKNILQRIETREKLDYHFDNIREIIKTKNENAVDYFDKLKDNILNMYETEKDEAARIYKTKEAYKFALKGYNCEELQDAIFEEIDNLPKTFVTKDSFFNYAYNHEYTDTKIINSLFCGLFASEEHICSVSQGGSDKVDNKIVMHRACNGLRKSLPYTLFLKYHPDMPTHTQTQINLITKELLDRNLPINLSQYPIRVAENLYNESKGIINLDIKEYCLKSYEQAEERIKGNEQNIKKLNEIKDEINERIEKIDESNQHEIRLQLKIKDYLEKHS